MYPAGKINKGGQKKEANYQCIFFVGEKDRKQFIKSGRSEKNQKIIKNGVDKIIASTENIEYCQQLRDEIAAEVVPE